MEDKEKMDKAVVEADAVVKMLFAIMNEEDDIEAYLDKTPNEMIDIIKLCNARYPDKKMASYDPAFTKFGQVFLNGYNTFGIDFIKLVVRRTDKTPELMYKGLIDIYENLLIQNQQLALQSLPEEERLKIEKELANVEDMSDEEFIEAMQNSTKNLENSVN